jgi:hypothetical protein
MNISWSDLGTVQEAGDYPFRDGSITVTFAEIAAWNKNPKTQFQLMRKHPIQGSVSYVLGKQTEEKSLAVKDQLIYQSSNGDSWHLTNDPATGTQAVLHRPNPQSGGRPSYITISEFLSRGASGPEHQALRRMLQANPAPHQPQ